MPRFKQQAYYIGEKNKFFVDRETAFFDTEEQAMRDLESFAFITENRIQNRSYKCIVSKIEPKRQNG